MVQMREKAARRSISRLFIKDERVHLQVFCYNCTSSTYMQVGRGMLHLQRGNTIRQVVAFADGLHDWSIRV